MNYIEARFDLGQNWTGYDSVRAVWFNDFQCISTVLDSQGVTFVPFEVMKRKGNVKVNLVGSISENDVLTDRLTSYPVVAVIVDCIAQITGANTSPITPSEYEQFVASVRNDADRAEQGASDAEQSAQNAENSAQNAETAKDEAEDARDEIRNMSANATTLPSGSDATASYSDGVLSLGIPQGIQGEKGDNGDTGATPNLSIGTVETLEPTQDAYVTRRGTDDNPIFDFGIPQGAPGEVTMSQLSALLPTDTASGDIASFSDGTDLFPALSVKAQIEPIQSGSGTPSPDNVRPISGHTEVVTEVCGVNVWDEEWEGGAINGGNGQNTVNTAKIRSTNYIHILPNTDYYFQHPTVAVGGADLFMYDANKNYLGYVNYGVHEPKQITTPTNAHFMRFSINVTSYNHDISINYPSTDHDYHAYDGNTYTTTLGRTVYGGTLDVVSGELVVDRATVDLGTVNWTKLSVSDHYVFYHTFSDKALNYNFICSAYPNSGQPRDNMPDNSMGCYNNSGYRNIVCIRDDSKSTLDETQFKQAMSGVQLCYELATPQTYQLDPQTIDLLLGDNNIWSDGTVEVVYKADIQRWVLKKLSE